MPRLPGYRGRVFLRKSGQFYGHNETLNPEPTEQLPQFLPRAEWPQRSKPHGPYLTGCMPLVRDEAEVLESDPARLYARDKWDYDNPDLQPMQPYQHASNSITGPLRPCYSDSSIWHDHAMILHHCLTHTIEKKAWLSDDEITELLTCVSYGMHQSMTWLPIWAFEPGDQDPVLFDKVKDGDFDAHMVQCNIFDISLFDPRPATLQRMLGRRWIAVPINEGSQHWFMTLFDRQTGQLYIFDAYRGGREGRIEAAIHMWAKFWREMGMPWHFQYFVAPVEEQNQGWECGLLAVAWIIAALRKRIGGVRCFANDVSFQSHDISMYTGDPDDYPAQESSISMPDWLPQECNSGSDGVDAIRHMFQAIIANELGLNDHEAMQAVERKSKDNTTWLYKNKNTAWTKLESIANVWKEKTQKKNSMGLENDQSTTDDMYPRIDDFYDGAGGLQNLWPATQLPKLYDPMAERTPRPANGFGGYINFCPKVLAAGTTLDCNKIQYGPRSHAKPASISAPPNLVAGGQDPVNRRNPFVEMMAASWCADVMMPTCQPNGKMLDITFDYLTSDEAPMELKDAMRKAQAQCDNTKSGFTSTTRTGSPESDNSWTTVSTESSGVSSHPYCFHSDDPLDNSLADLLRRAKSFQNLQARRHLNASWGRPALSDNTGSEIT